ncbi:hypothetical protein Tco_0314739, partial [Tanacetum coccineum]
MLDYGFNFMNTKIYIDNEAEYVAAASCCGHVLWIQNQMLDYGFNFMNTKIYIDNESTIWIVKNPVYHCTAIEMLKKNTAKALISLFKTITLLTTMVVLDSCPKHNMVTYLEKSEGNAEFH